jgi:uncharacterized protein DUF1360
MATLTKTYDRAGEVDLRGFSGSLAAYAASVGILIVAGWSRGRRLPERYAVGDVVLGGLAVHKFTRLASKSSVASPLRAPFTEFEEAAGSGEHVESPRGVHGVRHTVGALLTCPFCLGVWVSTAYIAALALAPRPARTWAALFAVDAVSDALQQGYERLRVD